MKISSGGFLFSLHQPFLKEMGASYKYSLLLATLNSKPATQNAAG